MFVTEVPWLQVGHSVHEVAERMGRSSGAVRSAHLQRQANLQAVEAGSPDALRASTA